MKVTVDGSFFWLPFIYGHGTDDGEGTIMNGFGICWLWWDLKFDARRVEK